MAIRTSEQLQLLFKKSKEMHLKEKEKKHQQYLEYQKLYRERNKEKLKEINALYREKNRELIRQKDTERRAVKKNLPVELPNDYAQSAKYIERFSPDERLYQTREELIQWEKENYSCINWKNFDKLVRKVRKQLKPY